MRRIILTSAVILLLSAFFAGCAMDEGQTSPTGQPTPLLTAGGVSGSVVPESSSPAAPNTTAPAVSAPDASQTAEISSGLIEGFLEGKVVEADDVPDITAAIEAQFQNAKIQSITQALHLNQQVYEVIFIDKDGQNITAYVSPDGQTVTVANTP